RHPYFFSGPTRNSCLGGVCRNVRIPPVGCRAVAATMALCIGRTRYGQLRAVRRTIATLPPFRGMGGAELLRIAQWGDVLDVAPGAVLLHEGKGDFWFFVI